MKYPARSEDAYASVMRGKSAAAQMSMMLAAKTQDAQLRKQAMDKLPELIKLVQQHDKTLPS